VVAGTTLGMLLANAPVVWFGDRVVRKVPIRLVHGIGAVVLLSIMFLSLPLLAGGLALIGIAKLVSRWRTRTE